MKMDNSKRSQSYGIEYGFVKDNNKVVCIKAGRGGSYIGYENKYERIAERLNRRCGCTVISISNPIGNTYSLTADVQIINECLAEVQVDDPQLYFFGHSDGGIKGIELAYSGIAFRMMLLVNTPLMINFHKNKKIIDSLSRTHLVMAFGENDPSFQYVPFLELNRSANLTVIRVPNADHNFRGKLDEFIKLSDIIATDMEDSNG